MRRVQFIELHEQPWFPASLRDETTDALQFGLNFLKAYAGIAPLLQGAVDSTGNRSIVDMCSGGGGPWLWLYRFLRASNGGRVEICLTDKYPNISAFENAQRQTGGQITFYPGFVDAAALPRQLSGFRTIFTSFHHFTHPG